MTFGGVASFGPERSEGANDATRDTKFCISIVFIFSWNLQWSQEK